MNRGEPMIRIRNLDKVYPTADGTSVYALKDVYLDIAEGEFLAVVGPSGCGKSTLLKLLGGLLDRTSGELLLHGDPIAGPRRDVGIVFQSAVLLPWLTVLDNVLVPVRVQGLDLPQYRQRALELLRLVGLEGFESKYPRELSGGMQQRVAICRALIHDPAILLMDEPFGALDAMTRESMNIEVQRIWLTQRKTVFFITHSIPEAVFLADRVAVMSARPGQIVREIRVDLPRPRPLEIMGTAEFGAYANEIRAFFKTKGALD